MELCLLEYEQPTCYIDSERTDIHDLKNGASAGYHDAELIEINGFPAVNEPKKAAPRSLGGDEKGYYEVHFPLVREYLLTGKKFKKPIN